MESAFYNPYMLPGLFRSSKSNNNLKQLLLNVCFALNVSEEDIRSKKRHQSIVAARAIFCYIARKSSNNSLGNIGMVIKKDHATVLYFIRKVETALMVDDETITDSFNIVKKALNEFNPTN